jgi:DNA polymerase
MENMEYLKHVASPAATVLPEEQKHAMDVLEHCVMDCTLCPELAESRNQPVFGGGSLNPVVVFVADAPGPEEDESGEPFVGPPGLLLQKMIHACGLGADDVYALTAVKCRPPEGRRPSPTELATCRHFLEIQIGILRPKAVVALGEVAAQSLLQNSDAITSLRGKVLSVAGVPLFCTFHPMYLIRTPAAKKDAWEDLKTMLRHIGRQPA